MHKRKPAPESATKPLVSSVDDTAIQLNAGVSTVYQLIKDGKLRTTKIGRRRLVFNESISELLTVQS
jgi:excisionase family DNA binding protein